MPLNIERVLELLQQSGLNHMQAAERAKMTKQSWADVIHGRRVDLRISTLEAIATALSVAPGELLTPAGTKSATKSMTKPPAKPKRQKRSLPSGDAGSKT